MESDEIIDTFLAKLRADCVRLEKEIHEENLSGGDSSRLHSKLNMVENYLVHLADQVAIRNINREKASKSSSEQFISVKPAFNPFQSKAMQIPIIKADILKTDADFLLHGCNCRSSMSGGLARLIAEKWPEVELADDQWSDYAHHYTVLLGGFSFERVVSDSGKMITVVNLYTQLNPGPDFQLEALKGSVTRFLDSFGDNPSYTYALPKIGCGLGGGNWDEVYPLLCELFEGRKATIYTVD